MNEVSVAPQLAELFRPHHVVAASAETHESFIDGLLPNELAGTEAMGPGRFAEFATGRACARFALHSIDAIEVAVPRAGQRAPIWPDGVTGSITHTHGWCAAVAALVGPVAAIGVDVEEIQRVRPAIAARVLTDVEREAIADMSPDQQQLATAVAFSAKEAFYKAHHQLDPRFIGFDVVSVERIDDELLRFRPQSTEVSEEVVARAQGRISLVDGRVLSAVAIVP